MRDGFWIELAMFFASDCSESSSDLKYAWIECLKKDRVLFSSRLSWIFVGIGSWGGFGFMVFLILISLGSLWAGSFPGEIFCCSWEPCRAAKHWPSLAIRSGSYTSYSCVVSSGRASLNERCSFSLSPNSSTWPPVLIWSAEGPCFCIWWSGPGCNNHTIQFSIGDSSVTGSWCSLHGQQAPLESWQQGCCISFIIVPVYFV